MDKGTSPSVTREKVKPGIWRRRNAKGAWVYEITFRDSDGRQRRQTVVGGMRAAETTLADTKARLGKGERVAPNYKLTFAQASEAWLDAKAPALTEKTAKLYSYQLRVHLLPVFGRRKLGEIDVSDVAAFVARMGSVEYRHAVEQRDGGKAKATTGYSVQTIKSALVPFSRTFAYAKRHLGHGGDNPVMALDLDERPGYKVHKQPKAKLGRDQLDRLMESSASPWREIIATAAALGTRMGETLGIHWRDVDLDAGKVKIAQQANAKREIVKLKSQSAYRTIEAPAWLISMLREMKVRAAMSGDDDLVFCTRSGKAHNHGNVLARGLYPALDRAGLDRVSFHSLRHTHASLWIKDGGDAVTLSKRLGHATPQVTMTTYADEIREANDDAARHARVDAMFSSTKMAAFMAASEVDRPQQTATDQGGEVVDLSVARNG